MLPAAGAARSTAGVVRYGGTAHQLDAGHRLDRGDQIAAVALEAGRAGARGLRQYGECAGVERVHRAADIGGIEARHHHDGGRELDHDLLGRLDAVHHGHLDVHRHDIGAQLLAQLDRLLAVARLADDLELGIAGQ